MALVAAKCTNCGANLQIEHTKDAGICLHCDTAFITEKAINNYNITNVNYNTQNIIKNIYGREKPEADEYVKNGDVFMGLGDLKLAKEQYELAIKSDPANWRVWFSMAKHVASFAKTEHYKTVKNYLEKAKAFAPPEDLQTIENFARIHLHNLIKSNERKEYMTTHGYSKPHIDDVGGKAYSLVCNALSVCPFCKKTEDWYWSYAVTGDLFICAECSAIIKCNFSDDKVKAIKVIDVGNVNQSNIPKTKYDSNTLRLLIKNQSMIKF